MQMCLPRRSLKLSRSINPRRKQGRSDLQKKITQEEAPVHEENPKRKRRKKIKSKATEKKTFAAPEKKTTMKKQRKKKSSRRLRNPIRTKSERLVSVQHLWPRIVMMDMSNLTKTKQKKCDKRPRTPSSATRRVQVLRESMTKTCTNALFHETTKHNRNKNK